MLAAIIPMSNQERRLLVNCRIPASTYAIIARLAAKEGRSITNWARQRIIEAAASPIDAMKPIDLTNGSFETVDYCALCGWIGKHAGDTHNCPANAVGGANG
jgi:hypothetical protein